MTNMHLKSEAYTQMAGSPSVSATAFAVRTWQELPAPGLSLTFALYFLCVAPFSLNGALGMFAMTKIAYCVAAFSAG